MNKIIKLEKLTKVYPGIVPTKALSGIDLEINEGEITAIVGQSGSGKSTFLNMIGILDTPTSGSIFVDGKNIEQMSSEQRAVFRNETIGFVFQFHYLLPEFTVLENVLMPSWIKHSEVNTKFKKKAMDLLDLVGLGNIADKISTKISGGQKQRTAIARALMNDPKIILADEPTGNLDTKNSDKINKLFRKINKETKKTFVIITHNLEIAKKSGRIIELEDGLIIKDNKNTNKIV